MRSTPSRSTLAARTALSVTGMRGGAARVAILSLIGASALGCTGRADDSYTSTWTGGECIDSDGDGFGAGCASGVDCDESDPSVTNECYYCVDNDPGCACDAEGLREPCGVVTNHSAGHVVCGLGERVCAGGEWGQCMVNNSVTLPPEPEPGADTQGLGSATPCVNNPCSLYCQEFADDATGLPAGSGVQTVDGGLSIAPSDAPPQVSFCFGGQQGSCTHSVCTAGSKMTPSCDIIAPPGGVSLTVFSETFANNAAGWTLGTEWEIGPTSVSSGQNYGNPDPAFDKTPTSDNGVAGIVLGGNASTSAYGFRFLTSPAVDVSGVTGGLTMTFARWLNMSGGTLSAARIQVWNGLTWITVQDIVVATADSSWTPVSIDLTAYKNAALQVRFGYTVLKKSNTDVSAWNIDDVTFKTVGAPPLPASSCVQTICLNDPKCCTESWTPACVAKVPTLCGMDCANVAGTCALCYHDSQDHDGDGYSSVDGDCLDCDPAVNPGAYDFPNNGKDEDCSGVADDEPANCDTNLSLTSSQSIDHAKAIGLCRTTTENALGKQRTWGVINSALVQANGILSPHSLSYGILSKFGAQNLPFKGAKMAAYSSGTARAPGDSGYVNPNGQVSSFNQGKSCAFPAGFPKNGAGCPSPAAGSSYAYDSSGLWMKVRVPLNAKSMSYKFNFFSSEYPEWVCTYYNDSFIALLSTGYQPANPASNSGNISFDSNSNPVTVNVSFFTVVGGAKLTGTGFDGTCDGQICGGATDWLQSTAPVVPGETITLQFALWDTGDHVWDSTVLIDDFQWSEKATTIQTFVPQPEAGPTYSTASFTRDYDVSNACPLGTSVSWGLWSWSASTPGDSKIEYYVQTASTAAGLAAAPLDRVQFTAVPGPASLIGTPAIAKAGVPDTQGGAALIDTSLSTNNRKLDQPFLRVTSTLVPSSDGTKTPTLTSWNQQFACVPSE